MEAVVDAPAAALPTPRFWGGRRVLLTGHTGFKGSWLALWLARLGAQVTGLALAPATEPSLFELARVGDCLRASHLVDLRDPAAVRAAVQAAAPQIVLHLAAQPLVRASYREPVATFATSSMLRVPSVDSVYGRFTAPATRATASSPSGWAIRVKPVGESAMGNGTG